MKKIEIIDPNYKDGTPTLKRNIAKAIFYSDKENFLLQERKSISRSGEEWGLFGGGIEEGENHLEAVKREVSEEIANLPEDLQFNEFCKSHIIYFSKNHNAYRELFADIFFCKLPENFKPEVLEGDGAKWFSIDEVKQLKMLPVDTEEIKLFEEMTKKNAK